MLHRYDKRAGMWWMTENCMNHLLGFVRCSVKDERERERKGSSNSTMNLNGVRHTQTTKHISEPPFPSYAAARWYRDGYWDNIWCLRTKCLFAFTKKVSWKYGSWVRTGKEDRYFQSCCQSPYMDMIWLLHILERDPWLNTWIWTELQSQVSIHYDS